MLNELFFGVSAEEFLIVKALDRLIVLAVDLASAHYRAHLGVDIAVGIVMVIVEFGIKAIRGASLLLVTDSHILDTIAISHAIDRYLWHDYARTAGRRRRLTCSLLFDTVLTSLLVGQNLFLVLLKADKVEV